MTENLDHGVPSMRREQVTSGNGDDASHLENPVEI
jgi:hypothetical protein